ncbi:MAG: helix-turn-helix domain-containing protein [Candidatus Andersenbacteria bacterium]
MHNIGKTEYMTVHEVAKQLGISSGAVRVWTAKGVLKAIRHPISKYRLYLKNDVERVLNSLENHAKE